MQVMGCTEEEIDPKAHEPTGRSCTRDAGGWEAGDGVQGGGAQCPCPRTTPCCCGGYRRHIPGDTMTRARRQHAGVRGQGISSDPGSLSRAATGERCSPSFLSPICVCRVRPWLKLKLNYPYSI